MRSRTFEPERVDVTRIWHTGFQDQTTWDCVPHAVNMLLGCPYLKERDQHLTLQALARKNNKQNEQENKAKCGVYLTHFRKALTDGQSIFSIKFLFLWNRQETESNKGRGWCILDELEKRGH